MEPVNHGFEEGDRGHPPILPPHPAFEDNRRTKTAQRILINCLSLKPRFPARLSRNECGLLLIVCPLKFPYLTQKARGGSVPVKVKRLQR
jgi:hypothetical protein